MYRNSSLSYGKLSNNPYKNDENLFNEGWHTVVNSKVREVSETTKWSHNLAEDSENYEGDDMFISEDILL